jgi:hypothetical protein
MAMSQHNSIVSCLTLGSCLKGPDRITFIFLASNTLAYYTKGLINYNPKRFITLLFQFLSVLQHCSFVIATFANDLYTEKNAQHKGPYSQQT